MNLNNQCSKKYLLIIVYTLKEKKEHLRGY